jgi:hypothetical protein
MLDRKAMPVLLVLVLVMLVSDIWQVTHAAQCGLNDADESRLQEETDWVHIEISTASEKKVPVIPLLIDDTPMLKPNDLPEDLCGWLADARTGCSSRLIVSHPCGDGWNFR